MTRWMLLASTAMAVGCVPPLEFDGAWSCEEKPNRPTYTFEATTGDIVSMPAGVPHVFQVLSEEARLLTIAGGGAGRPGFDQFVVALSETTDPDALPEPVEVDPGQVAQVAAQYGITILGPPPGPLD